MWCHSTRPLVHKNLWILLVFPVTSSPDWYGVCSLLNFVSCCIWQSVKVSLDWSLVLQQSHWEMMRSTSVLKFSFADASEEGLPLAILEVVSVAFSSEGHILHRWDWLLKCQSTRTETKFDQRILHSRKISHNVVFLSVCYQLTTVTFCVLFPGVLFVFTLHFTHDTIHIVSSPSVINVRHIYLVTKRNTTQKENVHLSQWQETVSCHPIAWSNVQR